MTTMVILQTVYARKAMHEKLPMLPRPLEEETFLNLSLLKDFNILMKS